MIGVAVLASKPLTRARLEALVVSRPGLRLAAAPLNAADDATAGFLEADVLLMDSGGRAAEVVFRAMPPRLPPVVLLVEDLAAAAFGRLLRAGVVRAILPRDASAREIAAGIEAVAAGLIVLHPSAPVAVTRTPGARRAREEEEGGPLTHRELEILTLMSEGMGNRAIAGRLGISTHTVKFHVAAILDKLNARSRTEAVTSGLRQGLLMV